MGFQGGCACKAIRYEASAEPMAVMNCHCRACQYASGGGYTTAVVLPPGTLKVTKGKAKGYSSKGDSGKTVTRFFCADCGSPLYSEPESSQVTVVKAGSMDDPSGLVMTGALYTSEAQPWAHIDVDKLRFEKMPPPRG